MRTLLLGVLLSCLCNSASAIAAAPTKPADTAETRNLFGPRADKLGLYLPFNDATSGAASSATLNAVGRMAAASPRDTFASVIAGASEWVATEGGGLKLADGDYVNLGQNAGGTAVSFPRGTILVRFSVQSLGAVANVFNTGKVTGSSNAQELAIRVTTAGSLTVSHWAGPLVTSAPYVFISADAYVSTDEVVTVLVTWGENGGYVYAWDGTAAAAGTIAYLGSQTTDSVSVPAGSYVRMAANPAAAAGGNMTLYALGWWDWQLGGFDGTTTIGDSDLGRLVSDPYLPGRPSISATLTETGGVVQPCIPQPWGCTWSFPADADALDVDGSAVRIRVADTVTKLETSPTYVSAEAGRAFVSADEGQRVTIPWDAGETITGDRYWIAEFTTDGTTWYPSPQGMGKLAPRPLPSEAWSGRFAIVSDCHVGQFIKNTSHTGTICFGSDIENLNASFALAEGEKPHAIWRAGMDIGNRGSEFVIHAGDGLYTEQYRPERTFGFNQVYVPVFLHAPIFYALGNHEATRAYTQRMANSQWAEAHQYLRWGWRNPDGNDYPEGGESELIPTELVGTTYRSDVDWLADLDADADTFFSSYIEENAAGSTWVEKLGRSGSPKENYYAFTWGTNVLIVVLDVYEYSDPGNADTPTTLCATQLWTLGPRQEEWLGGVLRRSTAKWKFVVEHQSTGGMASLWKTPPNDETYYGRTSGASITSASQPEEWRLHNLYRDNGVTAVIAGHDHALCHVVNHGVNYIRAGSLGGDRFYDDLEAIDYGHFNVKGTDYPGVRAAYAQFGYVEFEISGTTSCTMRFRQIASTDETPWETDSRNWTEWLGDPVAIGATDTAVTLDETPWDVLGVVASDDGDFSGGAAHCVANWATDNRYTDLTDGTLSHFLVSTVNDEPYASGTISFANADETTSIRVHAVPRTIYQTFLQNAPGFGAGVSISGESGEHRGSGMFIGETGVHAR